MKNESERVGVLQLGAVPVKDHRATQPLERCHPCDHHEIVGHSL